MNDSTQRVSQLSLEAWDYWKDDGIPTLISGIAFIVAAAPMSALCFVFPLFSWKAWGWIIGFLIVWMLAATTFLLWFFSLMHEDFAERIKMRFTYPRTGYVAPPSCWPGSPLERTDFGRWVKRHRPLYLIIAFSPTILWILSLFLPRTLQHYMLWVVIGVMMLCWLTYTPSAVNLYSRKLAKNKLYWIEIIGWSIIFAAFTLLLLLAKHIGSIVIGAILLTPGIFMVLKGALFLFWYLHRHPLPKA
jgi:hypothetical protein